jgi:hypothetical protein
LFSEIMSGLQLSRSILLRGVQSVYRSQVEGPLLWPSVGILSGRILKLSFLYKTGWEMPVYKENKHSIGTV